MAIWLKRGATAEAKADAGRKVRDIVEAALADIEARGDDAVREMSIKFDGWDRDDYRLSQAEIDACVDSLTPQERKDIEFAQAQVKNFAQIQRDSMLDVRWEASARLRHLGGYPLIEDNSVRDKGSDVVNLRGAYKPGRLEIYAEALNLLGSKDKDIAYFYESFIPGFDAAPVEGRLSRVVEPRTFRIGAKYRF